MNTRGMFLLLVAMVVLATPSTARVFPPMPTIIHPNDELVFRDEDLANLFAEDQVSFDLGKYGEAVHDLFEDSLSPSNAPEPSPVPEPAHEHKHKHKHHHKHDQHEDHHHKDGDQDHHHKHEHSDHHHKHEHKDHHHHHSHNSHHHALPPSISSSAPAPAPY